MRADAGVEAFAERCYGRRSGALRAAAQIPALEGPPVVSGAWERCWNLVAKKASILVVLLVVAGFALRYSEAARTFLHPDEALLLHTAIPASFHDLMWAS